jgi:hypothetical protein
MYFFAPGWKYQKWTLALVLVTMVSWLVMMADLQRIQENPNRLFLQARPPTIDHRNRTGYRGQLNIPQSFAGLKVAPSIYRWMNGLYGGAGIYNQLHLLTKLVSSSNNYNTITHPSCH